jgi:hypothetical protein
MINLIDEPIYGLFNFNILLQEQILMYEMKYNVYNNLLQI